MLTLTQEEVRFLLGALQGLQVRGDRKTVRKTMEIADSIEEKLKGMLEQPASEPLHEHPPKPRKRK